MDYNIATNNELKEEKKRLEKLYDEAQKKFAEAYKIMMDASETYIEIQKIIDKREGKNAIQ